MPAPTNTDFSTATEIATFPCSLTQRADDGVTIFSLFYKFTAPARSGEISVFGIGDLSHYHAHVSMYYADFSQLVNETDGPIVITSDRPMQVPVIPGQLYYIKVDKGVGDSPPATLSLTVTVHEERATPVGSYVIPDDNQNLPLAIISATEDYTVLRFINPFPPGEQGDVLDNGVMLFENNISNQVELYSDDFSFVKAVARTGSQAPIRTCRGAQKFYFASDSNPPQYATMTADGTTSAFVTLTGSTSIFAMAASNDESILYFSMTGTNQPVKRWNIPGGSALTNFVAGVANYDVLDILVLADDTIIVSYIRPDIPNQDTIVKRFNASATLLNTYNFGKFTNTQPRLFYTLDDPETFGIWLHPSTTVGQSNIQEVRVSDGVAVSSILSAEFEVGTYAGAASATPPALFGHSFSCPIFVLRTKVTHQPPLLIPPIPCCKDLSPPSRKPLPPGSGPGTPTTNPGDIPPFETPVWIPVCAGGGTVPTQADLADTESWV